MSIPGSASPLFFGAGAADAAAFQIDRSLRFNSGDSSKLTRTFSASNRKTFTYSCWVKRAQTGTKHSLFHAGSTYYRFDSGDDLYFYHPQGNVNTDALFRDPSAWYHIVLAVDTTQSTAANRVKIYVNGTLASLSGTYPNQDVNVDINSAAVHTIGSQSDFDVYLNGYLAEVQFVDGQQLAASDFGEYDSNNVWQPKDTSGLTFGTNGFRLTFADNSSNTALGNDSSGNDNDWSVNNLTAESPISLPGVNFDGTGDFLDLGTSSDLALGTGDYTVELYVKHTSLTGQQTYFSDANGNTPGLYFYKNSSHQISMYYSGTIATGTTTLQADRWYHVAASRVSGTTRLFLDGSLEGSGSDTTDLTATRYSIADSYDTSSGELFGQVSNFRLIKGTGLYNAAFTRPSAPLTNVTNTKVLCCQSNSSTTAASVAPNTITASGNPFANTFSDSTSANDSLIDTPTNYSVDSGNAGGNYCTLNPLDRQASNGTLSNGNLDLTSTGAAWAMYRGTMFVSSGKWYWECTLGNNQYSTIGICSDVYQMASATNNWVNGSTEMFGYYPNNGKKYNGGSGISYATGDTTATGSVVGVALDMDNGTLTFYKDGTSLGQAFSGLTGKSFSPTHWLYQHAGIGNADAYNFGQRPFAYTPPSNHLALVTTNLSDPTIADGSTAFDAITYVGTDTTRTFTGFNMSPDLAWFKSRSTAYDHILFDSVRGATKRLKANSTGAEDTNSTGLTAFTSDGFTVGGADSVNGPSNHTYVAWAWDAGTSTVSNTDGSITSSVRANQTAGFSIVTYTDPTSGNVQTVGHGLNAAPEFIIVKSRTGTTVWLTYHKSLGKDYYTRLEDTDASYNVSNIWGSAEPTSSVFGVKGDNQSNMVAYCFAPVEGYSAFGTYLGNSDANGSFAFCGFAPALVVVRASSASGNWYAYDRARGPINPNDNEIYWNLNAKEYTINRDIDFLSNGFKIRTNDNGFNASGVTYIWMAWAEHPLKNARAR